MPGQPRPIRRKHEAAETLAVEDEFVRGHQARERRCAQRRVCRSAVAPDQQAGEERRNARA